MIRRYSTLVTVASLLLFCGYTAGAVTPSCGCGQAPPGGAGTSSTIVVSPDEYPSSRDGNYILYISQGYDPNTPMPLVVGFHGWTGSAASYQNYSRMNETADVRGLIAAYPDGVDYPQAGQGWAFPGCNASPPVGQLDACGRRAVCANGDRYDCDATTCPSATCSASACTTSECQCVMGQNANCNWCGCVDDDAFVRAIVDDIASKVCIDLERVFATGMSQGGMMTSWLSGRMHDVFAAFAPVAGTDPRDFYELPPTSADIGVMWIHGTQDTTVPHDGNPASDGYYYEAASDEAERLGQHFSCDAAASDWPIPASVNQPTSSQLDCTQHDNCPEGSPGSGNRESVYCLWRAGHVWPKRSSPGESALWGNRLMVEFFMRHRLEAVSATCACAPGKAVVISGMALDPSGQPVLTIDDPNAPTESTGINVYRSTDPALAPASWTQVDFNAPDGDAGTQGHQWSDNSGQNPLPGGAFFYEVAAYNAGCPSEGPR